MTHKAGSNSYIISVGSNIVDGESAVADAVRWLQDCLSVEAISSIYSTPPLSGQGSNYFNLVARGVSSYSLDDFKVLSKEYELRYGRDDNSRRLGVVPIDIDVVVYNNDVVRPRDYEAEYFKIGFAEISK